MTKAKTGKCVPSAEQKKSILNALWYEIVFTFGIPPHNPTDYCQWETVNFTRMGHARVLYTFFETPLAKRHDDDVLSEDYGFAASKIDRPEEDRTRLNKDLFHLTYSRLRHTHETQPWPATILSSIQDRCISFMEHIATSDDHFENRDQQQNWNSLLVLLKQGRELLISGTVDAQNGLQYRFAVGRPLPGGKIILSTP
jgi:hypothetical protein